MLAMPLVGWRLSTAGLLMRLARNTDGADCKPNKPGPPQVLATPLEERWAQWDPGMLTHGGSGGSPAALASRLHMIPTRSRLDLHGLPI